MRNVRYIIAVLTVALVGVAIPAQAQEQVGCVTVGLTWTEGNSPNIVEYLTPDNGVNTSIVGDYLWLQYNSDGSHDSWSNVLSIEIPDGAETFTACIAMHDVEGLSIVEGPEATPVTVEVAEVDETIEVAPEAPPAVKVVPVLTTFEYLDLVEEWVAAKGGFWIL